MNDITFSDSPDDREKIIQKMIADQAFRLELTTQSHYWFFHCYLKDYIQFPTADMHREMIALTQSDERLVVVLAFRGSGKSTVFTQSYPLWAILGKQQKKFIVILSQTQRQARQHLMNIKDILDHNELLRRDLGPFKETQDEWGGYSLVLSKYDARITACSAEQSIRGLRHLQYRPDLIIVDDIEDLESVKTRESREKTYSWLTGDIMPAAAHNAKIVIVGMNLNDDSAVMRFVKGIKAGEVKGITRSYPIVDENNVPLWAAKFPLSVIEEIRIRINNVIAWSREYLLKLLAEAERVILKEWIKYASRIPSLESDDYKRTYLVIDPAISQKDTADYTAMVMMSTFGNDETLKIYIYPNPVNERLTFHETIERAKLLSRSLGRGHHVRIIVEENGYQKALLQELKRTSGLSVDGISTSGTDKRTRLSAAGSLIQAGDVFFAEKGNETLIQQLLGFPSESHDDLADAFALGIMKAAEDDYHTPYITVFSFPPPRGGLADYD
ncbi:MAG: phage terminase large subunit [Patescibacteria group bacterium]